MNVLKELMSPLKATTWVNVIYSFYSPTIFLFVTNITFMRSKPLPHVHEYKRKIALLRWEKQRVHTESQIQSARWSKSHIKWRRDQGKMEELLS